MGEGLERLLAGRRLSPVQRRIAHYLDEHLAEAVFLSSIELAGRAGVSQPSVTRFAMALGFAGYPELRRALRPLVVRGEEPGGLGGDLARDRAGEHAGEHAGERARGLGGERGDVAAGRPGGDPPASSGPGSGGRRDDARGAARSAVEAEIANLYALRERLAASSAIAELGAALAVCEPLPVLGLHLSAGLATAFAGYARRVHPDVRPLTAGGPELADGLHAARKAGADWLLAVVLPRYPAEAVRALGRAKDLGLRTAVITDRADVPFAADVVLPAPVDRRRVVDSHAAPLALAMVLIEAMADAAPLRTGARLEEYERTMERMGVYLRPARPL